MFVLTIMRVDTMTIDEKLPSSAIWSPSENLSPRVKKLRDHFYSFHEREETNEPYSFTSGTPWDEVYSYHDWANEPAMYMFLGLVAPLAPMS